MKKHTLLILIIFFIAGCSNEPAKSKGIPEGAFWRGGKCGGLWFLIDNVNEREGTIHCKIYNDNFGHLILDGKFALDCSESNGKIDFDDLESLITGVDWGVYDNMDDVIIILKRKPGGNVCHFMIKKKSGKI